MARRVTPQNTTPIEGAQPETKSKEKTSLKDFVNNIKEIVTSSQFKLSAGIILSAVALMLIIAYISFFFTGSSDYSIVTNTEGRQALRGDIHNALGLPGAIIARWLVDGTFGIVSLAALVAMALFSAQLIVDFKLKRLRLLFISLFILIWGSVTLGFIHDLVGSHTFFRWGGAVGQTIAVLGKSYVQWLGMAIILITTLIVFFVLADKNFIEHSKKFWAWLVKLFKRKNKDSEATEPSNANDESIEDGISVENIQEEAVSETIDIVLTSTEEAEQAQAEEAKDDIPVIVVDVEQPQEEFLVDEESKNDIDVDITEVNEVETAKEDPQALLEKLGPYDPRKDLEHYKFPSLGLLKVYDNETAPVIDQEEQQANANRIVETLRNFDIQIESIKATVGPTVTLYEIVPKAGIKIAKIQGLENDIMLSLAAIGIRIIAPMPGKGTIGIEVPNEKPQIVSMHSVIASKRFQEEQKMRLPIAIGRTITNEVFTFDLAKTPHLLVAGATGQGKSVGLNAILTSLLYKKHPAELKFVLVDPKMVEFSIYKPLLKHYMAAMPDQDENDIIITDCQKVINTLNSLVIEMENRYQLLMQANCRNLEDYNEKFINRRLNPEKGHRYMPYLVIVIDEYGDFIMQAGKEVERPIQRIAQKARAVGMHMILATQRPDVKIVTGTIKANIPTRIAFRTQSVVDSRTVLDCKGADQLIGKGDMLYSASGAITRIQCAFVDTPEVENIVKHIEKQQHYFEPYQLPEYVAEGSEGEALAPGSVDLKRLDPMFADVARYTVSKQEGSTSRIQRAFEIGYNRAGKLSDQLEAAGIVGPNKGPKGRDVLIQDMESLDRILQELGIS